MRSPGWFKESYRHGLAAKGISTSYFARKPKGGFMLPQRKVKSATAEVELKAAAGVEAELQKQQYAARPEVQIARAYEEGIFSTPVVFKEATGEKRPWWKGGERVQGLLDRRAERMEEKIDKIGRAHV